MRKRLKGERGVIVIEATISLTAFLFLIVTILSITNICIIQARVTNALNATAKEIAQYSYLYSMTGINESLGGVHDAGTEDTKPLSDSFDHLGTVFTEIQNIGKTASSVAENPEEITPEQLEDAWNSIAADGADIDTALDDLEGSLSDIMDDPQKVIFGIGKLAAVGLAEEGKQLLMELLAKGLCKKHLQPGEGGSIESYLRSLGVVPSDTGGYMGGLDFSGSKLFPVDEGESEMNTITVTVAYDVKLITMLPIDLKMHFVQSAKTYGWTISGGG